jgi:hypothetical protein
MVKGAPESNRLEIFPAVPGLSRKRRLLHVGQTCALGNGVAEGVSVEKITGVNVGGGMKVLVEEEISVLVGTLVKVGGCVSV